jgi:proton-translocating NADH-quinone oxidoreductase chain L
MYILVVLLPLLSSILIGFYGYRLGYRGVCVIALIIMSLSSVLSVFIFYEVAILGNKCFIEGPNWLVIGVFDNSWGLLFDTVTSVMLIVVCFVSLFVHLYSCKYMEQDPHVIRFMSYLGLFTFFMLFLVTGDNLASIFLGWEGVGLASYLLINFWYTRTQANKAAIKAIIVNRFGDLGIMMALCSLFYFFKSVKIGTIFSLIYVLNNYEIIVFNTYINIVTIISISFFVGAASKSAQCGLHTWLPDAMEGPTPVSALIHAATMVTAGVFVLIRFSPILEYSFDVLIIVSTIGCLTAFFAGTIGLFQYDLKRVIAYSTCSQLGYMVMACGMSVYSASMFHLMTHAFFKALLFLGAGSVIHGMADEQDMRKMGGLLKLMPFTYISMSIGSLALMGFPFTAGFYSKDFILEAVKSQVFFDGLFCYYLGVFGAFCTAYYSLRALYMTFIVQTKSYKKIIMGVHDAPLQMGIPLFILALASIFIGYLAKDMFLGLGSVYWDNSILLTNIDGHLRMVDPEYMLSSVKFFPVFISILGGLLGFIVYKYYEIYVLKILVKDNIFMPFYVFFIKKWIFDVLYNRFVVNYFMYLGNEVFFKKIDRGVLEVIGPSGLVRVSQSIMQEIFKFQSGYVFHYVFLMVLGLITTLIIIITHYLLSDVNSSLEVQVLAYLLIMK